MLWGKVDHLLIRISNPWSTLSHPLILRLRRVFGKCFRNNDFCCCSFLSLCNCRQSTVINLIFGGIHRENFDISVGPKLEGKCKIPHFSLLTKKLHPNSKATATRNASIWCALYESTRYFPELLTKAGGWVVYFAPMVRFTPPSPTSLHYPMSIMAIDPTCLQAILPMWVTLFPSRMLCVTNIPSITVTTHYFVQNWKGNTLVKGLGRYESQFLRYTNVKLKNFRFCENLTFHFS